MSRLRANVLAAVGLSLTCAFGAAYMVSVLSQAHFGVFAGSVSLGFRPGVVMFDWGTAAIAVPLWAPASLFAAATACFVWLARRPKPRAGHCSSCGYDLSGKPSATCPECGTAVSAA